MFAGQRYATGERFSAADGCNTCTCSDDGRIDCTNDACPSAVREADAGVTVCLSGNPACSVDRGCRNDAKLVNFGDSYHEPDGCRSCLCVARGIPVRGSFTCYSTYCQSDRGACGSSGCDACMFGERSFELGAIVSCPDGCNTCACGVQGQWAQTPAECAELERLATCADTETESATVSILYLEPKNAALALKVEHRGGCAEHRFSACFEPEFLEASPPLVRVRVFDQSQATDSCDVPLLEELVYDVSPIRERFEEQYGNAHGEVALRTRDDSIRYSF